MLPVCYRWGGCNVKWKDANWLWSECQLIEEITSALINQPGVDASTAIQPWLIEPWNPYKKDLDKKKRLIRLICKVKGEEFDETKEVKNIKIKAEDIKMVVKAVLDINLDIKEKSETEDAI